MKNKVHLLSLDSLSDRLINLSMVTTYTHSDNLDDHDAQEEQEEDEKNEKTKTMELSSLVNGGQQFLNKCTIITMDQMDQNLPLIRAQQKIHQTKNFNRKK